VDAATGTINPKPRRTREEKRAALLALMRSECSGAHSRLPGSAIARRLRLDKWDLYNAFTDLILVSGELKVSEDTGSDPGSYLAESPDDVRRTVQRYMRDIARNTRTMNALIDLARRKFGDAFKVPAIDEQIPPAPAARYAFDADETLKGPIDDFARRRKASESGPIERAMLSQSVERSTRHVYRKRSRKHVNIQTGPAWSLWVCTACGEELVREGYHDAILTHAADGGKLQYIRRLAAEEVAVTAQ
jgi:hypothetical protein